EKGPLLRALSASPVLGFEPVREVRLERLFPRARLEYEGLPVETSLEAFSPFIPGDAATSGTPAAIFVFRIRNPSGARAKVSLLAGFENVLGCGGPRRKHVRDRTGNFVDGVARQGFAGVRFVTDRTFGDERRNHLGEYALLAQAPEGGSVTIRAYDAGGNGADLREDLAADGRLDGETGLRGLEGKVHPGGAVCVSLEIPPGESRECAFAFAWHLPHFVTADGRDHPPAYTSRLASAADAAAVALRRRSDWLAAVREWQDLLLDSTLPGWLVSRICEGASPLVTDTVWTADGVFGTLDRPGEGGALGALDRRLSAHAFSFAFFPALDREELRRFGKSQRRDGEVPSSFGNLHDALDVPDPEGEGRSTPDASCSFVLQVEKTYRWAGDRAFLEEMLPAARRALDWLATRDRDGDGIPEAGREPATRAREASLYLAALRAGEWIGRTVGDASLEKSCADRFERARRSAVGEL
ncbi:MAG TPA: GH116 family glycosyl-hydrolase, partial [Planctomycetota bacterium]|nr:GH116 family glycosyl-hydrolase [Planctomycetota bacterium]